GLAAEGRGAPAEHLARGQELRVHLEPDDGFVVGHRALASSVGRRARHEVTPSYARATRRRVASSKARPMSWSPMGKPAIVKPAGTETPGSPARFVGIVKTSFRYICSGSSRSPNLNATPGVVGAAITSTRSKAWRKSRRTSVLTRCALP